jgi:transcription elongation factor Elf1
MSGKSNSNRPPHPPAAVALPLLNASDDVLHWLDHYWHKLRLPLEQAHYLALTQDRREFAEWTGRRLQPLALGCYCYLPLSHEADGENGPVLDYEASTATRAASPAVLSGRQLSLPGFTVETDETLPPLEEPVEIHDLAFDYRHLIFIEPGMSPLGIEVTVAHELIHLSDRIQGKPRKHRCHGHDSISVDEAAITGRDPEMLRQQLRDETERREAVLREKHPIRYVYTCPVCGKEYPRVKKYARPISCGICDDHYNPAFTLTMRELAKGEIYVPKSTATSEGAEKGAEEDEGAEAKAPVDSAARKKARHH